jgi:pantoate--beta-alanine ligase
MSSRNAYLSPADRQRAVALITGLRAAKALADKGEKRASALLAAANAQIAPGVDRIDYLEVCGVEDLKPLETLAGPAVMLVAAFVGGTRLIDNITL